jgi:hypothetical protein
VYVLVIARFLSILVSLVAGERAGRIKCDQGDKDGQDHACSGKILETLKTTVNKI